MAFLYAIYIEPNTSSRNVLEMGGTQHYSFLNSHNLKLYISSAVMDNAIILLESTLQIQGGKVMILPLCIFPLTRGRWSILRQGIGERCVWRQVISELAGWSNQRKERYVQNYNICQECYCSDALFHRLLQTTGLRVWSKVKNKACSGKPYLSMGGVF